MATLIGTADGVLSVDPDQSPVLAGHRIDALARGRGAWWVLSDGDTVWNIPDDGTPSKAAGSDETRINCLLARDDEVLLGAEAAQLFHFPASGDQGAEPTIDQAFQDAPGRDDWFTPWGGPPDVRSLAEWHRRVGDHAAAASLFRRAAALEPRPEPNRWLREQAAASEAVVADDERARGRQKVMLGVVGVLLLAAAGFARGRSS